MPWLRPLAPRRSRLVALVIVLTLAWAGTGSVRAGAWTQPPGQVWLKVSGLYQRSDEFYADQAAVLPDGRRVEPGDERPYDDGGESRQQAVFLEAEVGVTRRWTVGLQAPWKELRYEDRVEVTRTWGWGDIRATSRVALLQGRHRLTLRGAVKVPTGRVPDEPGRIQIGENQTDLELQLQWGRSLGRPLSWVGVDFGRRFRFEDEERGFDPGDEWVWLAEAGWGLDRRGRVGLKLLWQGSRGDETSLDFFAQGTSLSRDVDQVELTLMVDAKVVLVELGVGRTLASEGYPSAPIWSLGLSRRVDWADS